MKNITKTYVGVDVSKKQLDIYIHPIENSTYFDNSKDGINKMIKLLSSLNVEQIVCESTGGYENLMIDMLRETDFKVWQVEPNRIKSFIRSKGRKAKTDKIDAKMIALFAARETPEYEQLSLCKNHKLLQSLIKRRRDLTAMIKAENLRLKNPSLELCAKDIKVHIKFMTKQIKTLEKKIQELIDNDDDLNKKAKIIESVPGVGKTTAAIIIAEMPELGKIENKKVAALVGVAPYTKQSGQYRGKAVIAGGRGVVRAAIYMAALVASRYNPAMKEFYERLCKTNKKPPKVALVAIMRKLIVILNVMIKKQVMWHYPKQILAL